jgi:Flp pilus assembly protein TadB
MRPSRVALIVVLTLLVLGVLALTFPGFALIGAAVLLVALGLRWLWRKTASDAETAPTP